MGFFLLLATLCQDPADLIRASIDAGKANMSKAANWLSREDIRRYDLDRNRKLVGWETYEASIVEGQNYYRLTARNGKPLKKAEREAEQEKLDREAERRRRVARAKAKGANIPVAPGNRYSLSLEHLLEHHEIQLVGEDTTKEGRKYWIIDTRVNQDAPLPKERNDMALAGNVTLWIDQETKLLLRRELRVTRIWGDWGPGSMVLFEMFWNGDVMLVNRITTRSGMIAGRARETEQTYSNFRKFGSETEIKFDSAEIPPN